MKTARHDPVDRHLRAAALSLALRALALAALWWVLAEGRAGSLAVAVPGIALALLASLHYQRRAARRVRWGGLLAFAARFIAQSIRGGIQVSLLAFSPAGPTHAAILTHPLASDDRLERMMLVFALGLMPGTVGVELGRDVLRIHVIDARRPVLEAVRATERSIARVFEVA